MASDPDFLSRAIVIWTGHGSCSHPARDEARLVEAFGDGVAADLLPEITRIHDDFCESDARLVAGDLAEMHDLAVAEFTIKHPDLSADAALALGWCYTFDYK